MSLGNKKTKKIEIGQTYEDLINASYSIKINGITAEEAEVKNELAR